MVNEAEITKVCTRCSAPHNVAYMHCTMIECLYANGRTNADGMVSFIPLRDMTEAEIAVYLIGGWYAVKTIGDT